MNCPKCQHEMKPVTLDAVQVDRCSHCQGIWFDAQEAELLRKVPGSEIIDIGGGKAGEGWSTMYRINCPRCGVRMERETDLTRPHIQFESCPQCKGSFFDAGEFRHYKEDTFLDFLKSVLKKDIIPNEEET